MTGNDNFIEVNGYAYLPEAKAIVAQVSSAEMFYEPTRLLPVTVDGYRISPWGVENDMPNQIIHKAEKSEIVQSNLLFNIETGYGQGIKPMKRIVENGKIIGYEELWEGEVVDFFNQNDINGYFLEQLTDMHYFYNVFPEVILSGDKRKIVSLRSKEAAFSRWGTIDPKKGCITKHYYSAMWNNGARQDNIVESDVLANYNPYQDLMSRISTGNYSKLRFIVPISFPTPGRMYYQNPYWWSIFRSGWYDFLTLIPEFKKALLKNQLSLKYVIYLSDKYFNEIFREEGTDTGNAEAIKARKQLEYKRFSDFLAGEKNAGKGIVALKKMVASGTGTTEEKYIDIVTLKNEIQGGEYLQDSEDASNIVSYAMGVHPSLIGSAPGKNSGFSGTDKRELFQIKQALMKPFRDRLLKPLELIKMYNRWQQDLVFAIPEPVFTTLDKNKTGQETAVNK